MGRRGSITGIGSSGQLTVIGSSSKRRSETGKELIKRLRKESQKLLTETRFEYNEIMDSVGDNVLIYDYDECKDDVTALFEKSQDAKDAKAQFNLASALYEGFHCEKNLYLSVHWYLEAIENGLTQAMNNLALMFAKGQVFAQDENKAMEWLKIASETGDSTAACNLGILYCNLEKPDYDKAFVAFKQAGKAGSPIAMNNIGCLYLRGYGVDQNYRKALKWFKKSSERGSVAAKYNIGMMYMNGFGVKVNFAKAEEWILKSQENDLASEAKLVNEDHDLTKLILLTSYSYFVYIPQ